MPGSSTVSPATAGSVCTVVPPCLTRISPRTSPFLTGAATLSASATSRAIWLWSPFLSSSSLVPPLTAGTVSLPPRRTGTCMPRESPSFTGVNSW